ncbi:hypothetical protein PIB30_009572 [Stylosanthes scabra]|uniref:Uncharacterized protein n=1 Tax=Stylosanthes scabra TaxID=79078 RepID=A0ABU6Q550_9FABA|nr:hypothetical protein [Stylosanthes scabra]
MVPILNSGSVPDVPRCYPGGAEISHIAQHGVGIVGTSLVRQVDSDEHVRALFDLHRRYWTREVMELLTEMQSMPEVAGGSSSSNGVIPCLPIYCPAPEVPMLMDANSGEDSDEDFVPY